MSNNKILITGISGFVGGHYSSFLLKQNKNWIIHGISRSRPAWDFLPNATEILDLIKFHQDDLLNEKKTFELIKDIKPDYILHLAAFSSVGDSWQQPRSAFVNNTNAFLNLVESVRISDLNSRILSVGSSEEYGIISPKDLPIKEDCAHKPENPYAVARVAQEDLAYIFRKGYNLNICCTRSFNHIGSGQLPKFVISSIAKQFAEIIINHSDPVIKIGDGSIVRDFIDIDDVITAYNAILMNGQIGEVYNVCNGIGHSITEVINIFSELLNTPVIIEQQNKNIRPIDNPILIGDNQKIKEHTGWKPEVSLKMSLMKIYDYWDNKLKKFKGIY